MESKINEIQNLIYFNKEKILQKEKKNNDVKPIIEKLNVLKNIDEEYKIIKLEKENLENEIIKLVSILEQIDKELFLLNKDVKICPLCSSDLTEEHLLKIKKEKEEKKSSTKKEKEKVKKLLDEKKLIFEKKEKDYLYFITNKKYLNDEYVVLSNDIEKEKIALNNMQKVLLQNKKSLDEKKPLFELLDKQINETKERMFLENKLKEINENIDIKSKEKEKISKDYDEEKINELMIKLKRMLEK